MVVKSAPHTCSLLQVTHTNLPDKTVSAILGTYVSMTSNGPQDKELSERLSREQGGASMHALSAMSKARNRAGPSPTGRGIETRRHTRSHC